ncbi:hypothetical protein [Holospora curviuscula]|uniref:Uncharacterized protein n=1 Tax=Holospora curviuscula TaxID=1082868 RepID=A0A2S5R6P0_9PROT|nr:hypothetical protein [Holospora curviuscula]PPE02998.1 hypothetical protein HCUR_01563 [Holospora curviuscula]
MLYIKSVFNNSEMILVFQCLCLWIILKLCQVPSVYAQKDKLRIDLNASVKKIETIIRKDRTLTHLVCALKKIYDYSIKNFQPTSRIKKSQIDWLKERNLKFSQNFDLHDLREYYVQRIFSLVNAHKKVREFFLKKFITFPDTTNKITSLSCLVSLCNDTKLSLCADDDAKHILLEDPIVIPLNTQKVIVGLKTSQGVYCQTYKFFLLSHTKNNIDVQIYNFPSPAKVTFYDPHILDEGALNLEKKGRAYYLSYVARITAFRTGSSVTWKIENNNCQVVEEELKLEEEA